ncbi:MAG: SusC/RagA family TonB-linked outer membrane protein, partial [Bacteroidales bacterium]|nr:SusC/RagA family TonB-linked outer membrane protein [Bacteroidales bacterium]
MKKFLLTIVLAAITLAAGAQVKGTVIDGTSGDPFPGVSVVLKGTNVVTITDDNGEFTIGAKPGDTIVFSFMGYKDLERLVNNAENIRVVLEEDSQLMDEIVVVGYGTQKKSDVTGSVASFNTKRLEERPNSNIIQTLQGAVAGLNISMTGSNAEGSSTTTRIRGNNSISASNKPLVVVDGIPFSGSWSEINSNDVESIEILKDASSAAIYGARGANGVILIQTKKGKGEKVTVSYDGYYAFTKAINIPDMMDGETFYQRKIEANGDLTATEMEMYENGEYTDWIDLALRNGSKMQHNLSLRGAGKTTKYYFSANVSNNKGIAINDDFNRYQLRLNLEQDLGKWVKVGTSTSYGYYDRSGNEVNFSSAFLMNPLSSPYQSDGSIRLKTWEDNNYSSNPLSAL